MGCYIFLGLPVRKLQLIFKSASFKKMAFTFVQARADKTTNANQCESQDVGKVEGLETPGFLAKAKRVPPS